MIAILAEKPSVGREIARVLGATTKADGCLSGNGYIVTWAYGHLVVLALPADYGFIKIQAAELPIIPDTPKLIVRKERTAKGMVTSSTASRQLRIIKKVFDQCNSIVVATDAGREGELIFRNIYTFLGCTKPFSRLWINSLTDEAIRKGFQNLREGAEFDNLYRAAACRARADWLVGINASQALCIACGTGNNSLGRVQTPTLAMICERWNQRLNFRPTDYRQMSITLKKDGIVHPFRCAEDITDPAEAGKRFEQLKQHTQATISKVVRKNVRQSPPLLYDLTSLQKDANIHYGMTAARTLEIAQRLYEHALISYPRTGSRYIPEDMAVSMEYLVQKILAMPSFTRCGELDKICSHSIDASKVTDHHALVITGQTPGELSEHERMIYDLIAGRMLEAFSPDCLKESVLIEADCGNERFVSRSMRITKPGWREIFARDIDKTEDEDNDSGDMPSFVQGEMVAVEGYNLVTKQTAPKLLFTEATLLTAMQNAGRELSDKEQREAIKDTGLGTAATRAAIIETLLLRSYMERSDKTLIPSAKGHAIYKSVKELRVADVALTGSWEQGLAAIERGEQTPETFDKAVDIYTRQVTEEILTAGTPEDMPATFPCPKCNTGRITVHNKIAHCKNPACGLVVFRTFLNKTLTDQHFEQLFSSGTTKLIKGFQGRRGNTFDACVAFDENFTTHFVFPEKQKGKEVATKSAKQNK